MKKDKNIQEEKPEVKDRINRLPPSERLRDQKWFWPVNIVCIAIIIGLIILGAWLGSTSANSAVFANLIS